jgi:hypothetical protein
MEIAQFLNDIPEDIARAAHRGTSLVPEQRARQERECYAATLVSDYDRLAAVADTDEKRARFATAFEEYRLAFCQRYVAHLAAKSRCTSIMVTGRSNFSVRRAEKANDREAARMRDLMEYRERAVAAIRKVLRPEDQPIMTGDADALTRLDAKIAEAERLQERMKQSNAVIRRQPKIGQAAVIVALGELGVSGALAQTLLAPDYMGRIGYAAYQLANNNAELRRLKERRVVVLRNRESPEISVACANARLEDAPPENRVRLFFPGKPPAEVRARLKSGGFRWAPSLGCWQAYRNPGTLALARELAGAPAGDELQSHVEEEVG